MSRSSHGETPFALAMNRLRIAGGRSVAAKRVLLVIVQQLLEFMEVVKPAATSARIRSRVLSRLNERKRTVRSSGTGTTSARTGESSAAASASMVRTQGSALRVSMFRYAAKEMPAACATAASRWRRALRR